MARLLVVHHSPTPTAQALTDAVLAGTHDDAIEGVEVVVRQALEANAEDGTRLADAGDVSDEAWANAAEHYDEEQLLALVCVIALINSFNRLNVITRQVGGDYQPGQHL